MQSASMLVARAGEHPFPPALPATGLARLVELGEITREGANAMTGAGSSSPRAAVRA
jgi:hypothetical protein